MKKKGFTLIELLAVIVILAVIALIATPAVLNVIEDSKKSAAEASARNIVGAAKTYYMQNVMDNVSTGTIDLSKNTFTYDGEQATKGSISYDNDGNAYGKMYISGYCVEVSTDGTIISSKTDESECTIDIPQVITYANGTVVYYNPVSNTKCTSSEAVSTTGTKTGCMRWYTFNDDGSDTVNLLLDHNTTAFVAWASTGTNANGPIELKTQLESDTANWNSNINARIIEANEIAKITEYPNWDNNFYWLHTNSSTSYKGDVGTNKYGWLFDNTNGCTTYGCNVADSNAYGYWTNTIYSGDSTHAWQVFSDGALSTFGGLVDTAKRVGVRPVITVSKSIIS